MSRTESHEYHFPPGLPVNRRSPSEPDHSLSYISNHSSFSQQDHHQHSNGPPTYPGFGNDALSRSNGLPEQRDQSVFPYAIPEINKNQVAGIPSFSTYSHISRQTSPPSVKSHTPTSATANSPYSTAGNIGDRDSNLYYRPSQSPGQSTASTTPFPTRSTLWWGELEPWMDEEYAKQVCGLKGWDPVSIKVPHPGQDQPSGQQTNNPGYCFLTFPTPAHAAAVLAQVNGASTSGNRASLTMPNSTKPFVMNWAGNLQGPSQVSTTYPAIVQPATQSQQYQKEYSIFVGDLAPETSNSDLVAVFRNPVLGLRADREPKFIRPFLSCKSAKIMLDPVTGVSRGYGFVRFTDEADQQRALIEMHGLYCLSRPMRISPATAKFKPVPQLPFDSPFTQPLNSANGSNASITLALPLSDSTQAKSVSAPIAATGSSMSLNGSAVSNSTSGSSIGGSHSTTSLSSGTTSSASISTSAFGTDEAGGNGNAISSNAIAQLAQQFAGNDPNKLANLNLGQYHEDEVRRLLAQAAAPRYQLTEESLKHHVQARAILSNLIGPNGEQLTSTDPYNTTVFVGGLSPLISEETLRTFFAPFGDIHYVKVPVGKHCGFVQFVRKSDAERAIEKMQGFPIGGSRIRLSWGRSQYKAAQAAAQAAQAAALHSAYVPPPVVGSLSQEQALQLLQRLGVPYPNPPAAAYNGNDVEHSFLNTSYAQQGSQAPTEEISSSFAPRPELLRSQSNFSPFSPDPNSLYTSSEPMKRDPNPYLRFDALPHPSKAFAPGFFPRPQDMKINTSVNVTESKLSPASIRPSSASRFIFAENTDPLAIVDGCLGRGEALISRPNSGQLVPPAVPPAEKTLQPDPIYDLNGTLANLSLDRPWRSPEVQGKPFS